MALEDLTPAVRLEEILDGQDIEPATRLEMILTWEDIEPATRLEYFLKKAVESGGGDSDVFDIESGEYTPTENIARPEVFFNNTHTKPPVFFIFNEPDFGDYPGVAYSNITCIYVYFASLTAPSFSSHTNNTKTFGFVVVSSHQAQAESLSNTAIALSQPDTTQGDTSTFPSYWATNEALYPSTNSTTRYWQAGRTYVWTALFLKK